MSALQQYRDFLAPSRGCGVAVPTTLGAKEQWRQKAVYLYLVYCGVRSQVQEKAMLWAELSPSPFCRGCDRFVEPQDADVLAGYWRPVWFVVHRACRTAARAQEAYACQCIDADCNDCAHFQRGVKVTPENARKDHPGWCAKFNEPTWADPLFASLLPCFEHRLAKESGAA